MASSNPDLDLFARVVNGVVTEYPVRRLHIQNRAQPVSWYTPVKELEKPSLPPFSYYKTNFTVEPTHVVVSYTTEAYTLAELLSQLRVGGAGDLTELAVPDIAQVDPMMLMQIMNLISDYTTDRLLEFAATRQYGTATADPFISASTYKDSTIPKFALESKYLLDTRDAIWLNLIAYQEQVMTGAVPVPTSIEDIAALIPELVWPEVPAV